MKRCFSYRYEDPTGHRRRLTYTNTDGQTAYCPSGGTFESCEDYRDDRGVECLGEPAYDEAELVDEIPDGGVEVLTPAVDAIPDEATISEVTDSPLSGITSRNVKDVIAEIEMDGLQALRSEEVAGQNRASILKAIDARISQLETAE